MKNFLQNILNVLKIVNNKLFFKRPDFSEKKIFLQGQLLQEQNKTKNKINNLKEVEFSVFSQFGDDGIMEISAQFAKILSNLNIEQNLKIDVSEDMKKYLRKHREKFRK